METKLARLMDRSSGVELKVAEIYDLFARCFQEGFQDDVRLAHFWGLFAEAERYHSLLIQLQKVTVQHLHLNEERLAIWAKEVDEAVEFMDALRHRLVEERWRPTVSEAFMLAHDIEGRSLEIQAKSLQFADQTGVGELFAKLHEEDMGHRHKLLQARHTFDPTFVSSDDEFGLSDEEKEG